MTMKRGGNPVSSTVPLALIAVGLVLIIGILLWQELSNTNQVASPTAPSADASIPDPNVARLSLADAKLAYDQKTALFVDVRDVDSYKAGHIPGALNIPLADFDARLKELKTNQWIVAYCT